MARKTIKTIKTNRAALVRAVASAAFGEARAFGTSASAIAAAGGDQDDVKVIFRQGYFASRYWPNAAELTDKMLADAAAIIKKPGSTGKAADRKTVQQETIYAAARQAWSRHMKKTGQKSNEKRGTKSAASKKANNAAIVKAPASPGFKTGADVHAHCLTQLASLLATCKKNAGKPGTRAQWQTILTDAAEAMKKVPAETPANKQ